MKTKGQFKKRNIGMMLISLVVMSFILPIYCFAWDYGDGRHGSYVLTTNATIEQLYQTIRLTNDPSQYNPADSNAIPNFQNLTIANGAILSANPWDGTNGGWIVLKVQGILTIASDSTISATAIGYRGGGWIAQFGTIDGIQGESYAGTGSVSQNANYGGGGGDGFYYAGGGGGGYATSGQAGQQGNSSVGAGSGGGTYGTPSLNTVYLGSGGGGGMYQSPSGGGNGGGAIVINAGMLNVQGAIQAAGANASGGGAGSGGSILLSVGSVFLGTNDVNANGGSGPPGGNEIGGGGGAGGYGRIAIQYAENYTGLTVPAPYTFNDTNSDSILITNQPTSRTNFLGDSVQLAVGFTTVSPFSMQWFFNGTPIANATNQNLIFNGLSLANQGHFQLIITGSVVTVATSNIFLTVLDTNAPFNDGIPNWWKEEYGLSTNDPTLATNYPTGDQLTYLEKYLYGLNPLTNDSDGDGLSDYEEIFGYHSNPLSTDTAGDGIPDGWKVQYGLNPAIAYADEEAGFDGVTYLQVYQYDLTHTNQLNPNTPFANGSGLSNYELINNGQHTNSFYYDHEDRLLGMESSRGISIGYQYDGNGNLTSQAVFSRASETNGLPVLWLWLNGLTNEPGIAYEDSSGNGWDNYQEWLAGLSPIGSNNVPSLTSNPGANIASLTLPFTPTNFVVGTGNLDGLAGDEIVVGADGNPGTNDNSLFVLTQTATNWSVQQINVGSFGITSIAAGQLTNRPAPAIYAGLRRERGDGEIVELMHLNGVWQTNIVAVSTNEAAFVLGVRGKDVLISLAMTNAPGGSLSSAFFVTNWDLSLLDTNASSRGLGIVGSIGGGNLASIVGQNQAAIRLLDNGGIQIDSELSQSIQEPASTNRYLWRGTSLAVGTPRQMATNIFSLIYTYIDDNDDDGRISTGDNFVLSEFPDLIYFDPNGFYDNFPGVSLNRTYWTSVAGNVVVSSNKVILTGANTGTSINSSGYFMMTPGQTVLFEGANIPSTTLSYPNLGAAGGPKFGTGWDQGQTVINAYDGDNSYHSTGVNATGPEALHEFKIVWNSNGKADYFIDDNKVYTGSVAFSTTSAPLALGVYDTGEIMWCSSVYCYTTTNAMSFQTNSTDQLETLSRSPITSENPAQSYGVAAVNFLNSGKDVVFTGEPGGQVAAWTISNPGAPLQRQLFSADYAGKAWHALSAVNTPASGQALAGLMVDPTNQGTCNVILWQPQPVLPTPTVNAVETAPAAAVVPSSNPLGGDASVTVRLWDNEGDASTPFLQYQFFGASNWQNATLTALDGSPYSSTTRVAAWPVGSNHILAWNALADIGGNVVTNILLRASADDFMLAGAWSLPTPFQVNTSTVSGTTNASPANFTGFSLTHNNGIQFNWQGGSNSTVFVQRSFVLAGTNIIWLDVYTGLPSPFNFGSYTDFPGTNKMEFYRLKTVTP